MKKFFKKILILGGTLAAAHFGFKAYKKISGTAKLSKSLPEFLNNVYGEMPQVNVNHTLNSTRIKLFFSQEILDKHTDIETTIREYIDDFYPEIAKTSVDISIMPATEETEDIPVEEETEEKE
ncbi:MAG: hypothetical protein QM209_05140 [Candidatus Cloacimonadota bacterium]|jgi:hypothetical protein|nr:hypothetical protein [Candidatus Cloacimonas sp.]MDI9572550.1 hypothetical protein [Candidatus Cloacimonadota bacterium]HOI01184.1 hypothetical protein [Candidatus Cloacimonas acidaminovorans]HPI42910.1 hypothetical protein [Candidatus Cloacimonas acidaminovorans]HPX57441.1 hypothetical protein [Candidatus Cloacimonas acidaminovorans]